MRKLLLMTILFWCLPIISHAAIVSFSPREKIMQQNETVEVSVWLDSELEIINTVQGEITYPKDYLRVEDIITGGSALDVWMVEPQVTVEGGKIMFTGGVTEGGYVINAKLFTIVFTGTKTGETEINLDVEKSQVLAYGDEKPEPVEIKVKPSAYVINPSDPYKINITSTTHPEENIWYGNNKLSVQWENTGALDYSYILNKNETKEPDSAPEQETGSKTYENLTDGVYYFGIKQKVSDDDWGQTTFQKFLIDTTPPDNLQALIGQTPEGLDGQFFVSFSAQDSVSGVTSYTVQEGKHIYENLSSPYTIQDQDKKQIITITAFDKAGNETQTEVQYNGQGRSYKKSILFIVILVVIVIAFFVLSKRRRKIK